MIGKSEYTLINIHLGLTMWFGWSNSIGIQGCIDVTKALAQKYGFLAGNLSKCKHKFSNENKERQERKKNTDKMVFECICVIVCTLVLPRFLSILTKFEGDTNHRT